MPRKRLNIMDSMALEHLLANTRSKQEDEPTPGNWVGILRSYMRMTQDELSKRTKIAQPYLADIEAGKADVRLSTLRRIYTAMNCKLSVRPEPIKPLEEVLRGRARAVALKRLKQSMGTMALEGQAPDKEMFKQLLEKKTDEILEDKRERLWAAEDE
jgi:transcriptional regulator with XRE-family HTH domain